jgi:hypothetical protein
VARNRSFGGFENKFFADATDIGAARLLTLGLGFQRACGARVDPNTGREEESHENSVRGIARDGPTRVHRGIPAMSFSIKGLDHVVLRVADLERAVRFYCEVLGCTEERRVESISLVQLRQHGSLCAARGSLR